MQLKGVYYNQPPWFPTYNVYFEHPRFHQQLRLAKLVSRTSGAHLQLRLPSNLFAVKVIHVRMWKLLMLTSLIVVKKGQLCLNVQM